MINSSRYAALVHAANCITLLSDLLHWVEYLEIAYGTSWQSGKRAGKRKVRKSRSLNLKWVDQSICGNIPAESTKTRRSYVIDLTDDVNSSGLDTGRPRCFWIQMILPRNGIMAVNNDGMIVKKNDRAQNDWWYVCNVSVNGASTILLWSVRQSKSCIVTSIQGGIIDWLWMQKRMRHAHCPMVEMSVNGASTERQRSVTDIWSCNLNTD